MSVLSDTLPNSVLTKRQSLCNTHMLHAPTLNAPYNATRWKNDYAFPASSSLLFLQFQMVHPGSFRPFVLSRSLLHKIPYIPRSLKPLLVFCVTAQGITAQHNAKVLRKPDSVLCTTEQCA
jgi:hypothetical protein